MLEARLGNDAAGVVQQLGRQSVPTSSSGCCVRKTFAGIACLAAATYWFCTTGWLKGL
jgi:hypothetical protein